MTQITLEFLRKLAPKADPRILSIELASSMGRWAAGYGVTTPLRVAHFVAQAAQETDGFKALEEYASGQAYEGRKDLGNTQKGDGVRFKGRGIFMLTGRSNYDFYGKLIKVDLVKDPGLAATPDVAAQIAFVYWARKGLNDWADRDDLAQITRRINGGTNGLATRRSYLTKAKALLGVTEKITNATADDPVTEAPSVPISPSEKPWYKSLDIGSLILAGVTSFGSAVTGASGPLAFAFAFAIVIFTLLGAYFLIKRLRGR